MTEALEDEPVENFTKPDPIIAEKPILNGQYQSSVKLKINKNNGLLATEKTPVEQVEERNFTEIHEILYWVNKNDPQGPMPDRPENDSQYENWENALQNWIGNNTGVTYGQLPIDYDR